MNPGRLITLEGGEGAGKSTSARYIQSWLAGKGREAILSREPGGSPMAEAIRQVVLQDWPEGITGTTEILMMFAARAAHLHATILPALRAGKDIVCDRFIDSTYAYQGAGKGIPQQDIALLEQMVMPGFQPSLTIVLDLDPRLGLERAHARGEQNRFEAQQLDYLQRVREMFLVRARRHPERYAVLDAGRPLNAVQQDLRDILEKFL